MILLNIEGNFIKLTRVFMKEKSGQTPLAFYISIDIVDVFNVILFILLSYYFQNCLFSQKKKKPNRKEKTFY